MSGFTVTEDAATLHIRIEEVGSRQAKLLEALRSYPRLMDTSMRAILT